VVQPEDAEADQELADGCNNTTGSPDGAVPTKCSMLGRSPNIGGAEVGCLSLQLEESDADQEPATGCGNAANMSNGAALADCSTLGLSPTVGGVEVVDSSQQSGIIATVSFGPVGVLSPSTMQQFDILKLYRHTPTICTTRDNDTADLVSTRTVAALLPANTPPHPPDQPGLLLGRPPPWPSTTSPTIRYIHVMDHVVTTSGNGQDGRTGWLLHRLVHQIGPHAVGLVTMPWDPSERLIMSWLYSCICCRVDIFEWTGLQQINEATMVFSVDSGHPCVVAEPFECPNRLYYHVSVVTAVACEGGFSCWQQYLVHDKVQFIVCFSITLPWDPGVCDQLSREDLQSELSEQYTSGKNTSIWQQRQCTETQIQDLSAAWATCEKFLARPFPDFMAFCDNSSGNMFMLSVTLPWDPGVCNSNGFANQQSDEVLITTSSCDPSACHMCMWTVYWGCLSKCGGAQHQYITYNSGARLIWRIANCPWSYLDLYELSTVMLQSHCLFTYVVCSNFKRIGMQATGVVFVQLTNLNIIVQTTIGSMLKDLSAASTACEISLENILIRCKCI